MNAWKRRGLEILTSAFLAGVFTALLTEPVEAPHTSVDRHTTLVPAWSLDQDVEFQRKVCRHIPGDLHKAQFELEKMGFEDGKAGEMLPWVIEVCSER